jgi:hypothetical protein
MKVFCVNIISVPYQKTLDERLNRFVEDWIGVVAPINQGIEITGAGGVLFFKKFTNPQESIRYLKNECFIFDKSRFISALLFQKKFNLIRVLKELPVMYIAIERVHCKFSFDTEQTFSLAELSYILYLKHNINQDILDEKLIIEMFGIDKLKIQKKEEGLYTIINF